MFVGLKPYLSSVSERLICIIGGLDAHMNLAMTFCLQKRQPSYLTTLKVANFMSGNQLLLRTY